MSINRVLYCFAVVIASSTAFAEEPTSLAQVKTLVVRDLAATAETTICIAHLEERLTTAGFTLVAANDPADAEITVTITFSGGRRGLGGALFGSTEYDVNYLIKVLSLPSRRQLFTFTGHQENSMESACNWMAKRTVGKIDEAKKAGVPQAKASD
jgi:hypothetical protein